MVTTALAALAAFESADNSVSGHKMESGYGGDGKSVEPHSYAAIVTAAIWGPKYNKNVWSPIEKLNNRGNFRSDIASIKTVNWFYIFGASFFLPIGDPMINLVPGGLDRSSSEL